MDTKKHTILDEIVGTLGAQGPCDLQTLADAVLDQVVGIDEEGPYPEQMARALNLLARNGVIELYDTADAWDMTRTGAILYQAIREPINAANSTAECEAPLFEVPATTPAGAPLHHWNTGCHYDEVGQLFVAMVLDGVIHWQDTSRYLDGATMVPADYLPTPTTDQVRHTVMASYDRSGHEWLHSYDFTHHDTSSAIRCRLNAENRRLRYQHEHQQPPAVSTRLTRG